METELFQAPPVKVGPPSIKEFIVIIGAMKSGTTTLYKHLGQHPQILRTYPKEPNFFGLSGKYSRPAEYFKLWPAFDPEVHRYALEGSTHYTKAKTKRVARRMRHFSGQYGSRFRCLYILRNPVDRIESHLAHNIAQGQLSFEPGHPFNFPEHAINVSRYAFQLDAFHAGMKNAEILLLDFAELCREPLTLLERCQRFLDLEPFAFTPIAPSNTRKTANSADTFRLDPSQRAALAEQLRPDVLALRDRYGFNVEKWGIA